MADIAQIGFAADTSGLDNANASLQKLIPASAAAASAADDVTDALTGTNAAAVAVSNAAKGTTTQTTATAKVVAAATGVINQQSTANKSNATASNAAAGAANTLAHAHAGLSTQAMAAQHSIRSMVEGLASGMPVSNVLTQQLNHLSYAASGPGGITKAFSDAFGMFTKLISASTLVIVAIVAVAAAFAYAAVSTVQSELALDDLSKSTNTTITAMHSLSQAAAFKGITLDDFTKGMQSFATNVLDAQHNMGSLNGLMIGNNMQAKTFQDYLLNVADLVSKTSNGVQKQAIIQAAGLPVTQQWVRFLSQGKQGILDATGATVDFNTAAETNLIAKARAFDDAWNTSTTAFSNRWKSAMVDALGWVDQLNSKILTLAAVGGAAIAIMLAPFSLIAASIAAIVAAGAIAAKMAGYGQSNTDTSKTPDGVKRITVTQDNNPASGAPPQTQAQLLAANQQSQQRISILGDLATVSQQAQEKQLSLNAATLNGVGVSSQMQAKIVLATTAQAEQSRVNAQAAAGVFNLSDAQKAASDTLQHWIDQGLVDKNNADQMAAAHLVLARNIKATSDAAAVAAAPLQQLKQLELDGSNLAKSLDTAATGALNNMVQPIQDMMNGVTGLNAGFKNLGVVVLQAIQQMIIKMLIITPIAKALQAVMGGMFGFSSGGIPGAVGPTSLGGAPLVPNALGGVYNSPNISSFSGQIVSSPTLFKFASGAGLMGEAGSEAIMPLKRGPSGSLGVQMFGQSSSANDNSQHVTYAPNISVGGNVSQDDLQQVKKQLSDSQRDFASNTVGVIKNMRKHNVRV